MHSVVISHLRMMTLITTTRSYSELKTFGTFLDRYRYLMLRASVGDSTFGFDRWINQQFYRSSEWRNARSEVIVRDYGRDLGVEGYEIHGDIYVHHMNPIRLEQLEQGDPAVFNPEYLICVTHNTHNAIHYGDESLLPKPFVERRPGDTRLW